MNNEKNFFFDAVGWKSYCSRLYGGARRWLGALGAQQAQTWAGVGAGRAGGMGAGALGGTGAGAQGVGARGARAAERGSRRGSALNVRGRAGWAAGARPGRWARGLGAWAGLGQCTRCTRPIIDPF